MTTIILISATYPIVTIDTEFLAAVKYDVPFNQLHVLLCHTKWSMNQHSDD